MKKHTVRRVLLLIRPYRFTVVGSLLLALASVASQLLIPIFSGRAIDAMVGKGRVDLDAVALAVAAIALIALLGALAQDMLARCNNRITFSVSRDLRSRISSKLNRLPRPTSTRIRPATPSAAPWQMLRPSPTACSWASRSCSPAF